VPLPFRRSAPALQIPQPAQLPPDLLLGIRIHRRLLGAASAAAAGAAATVTPSPSTSSSTWPSISGVGAMPKNLRIVGATSTICASSRRPPRRMSGPAAMNVPSIAW
jgi:hypothetical protein